MPKKKYSGKCTYCAYRDVVDKKWWGCSTPVCTYTTKMGKALHGTDNIPSWCPLDGVPKHKGVPNKDVALLTMHEQGIVSGAVGAIDAAGWVMSKIGCTELAQKCSDLSVAFKEKLRDCITV